MFDKLLALKTRKVMFDANVFMVGLSKRSTDPNYSFDKMKQLYIIPILEFFSEIIIHQAVYNELDYKSKELIDTYVGLTVTIVDEKNLYNNDPKYIDIFNKIANWEAFSYNRRDSRNKGEVYSLAYAAYYQIDYFTSRDGLADEISSELDILRNVSVLTFDKILLIAYLHHLNHGGIEPYLKSIKSLYKTYCTDVMKRHGIPKTFGEYIRLVIN